MIWIFYRFWMRLAHKWDWHYAPVIGPLEDGSYQRWCKWCGFRQSFRVPNAQQCQNPQSGGREQPASDLLSPQIGQEIVDAISGRITNLAKDQEDLAKRLGGLYEGLENVVPGEEEKLPHQGSETS